MVGSKEVLKRMSNWDVEKTRKDQKLNYESQNIRYITERFAGKG